MIEYEEEEEEEEEGVLPVMMTLGLGVLVPLIVDDVDVAFAGVAPTAPMEGEGRKLASGTCESGPSVDVAAGGGPPPGAREEGMPERESLRTRKLEPEPPRLREDWLLKESSVCCIACCCACAAASAAWFAAYFAWAALSSCCAYCSHSKRLKNGSVPMKKMNSRTPLQRCV